MGTEDSVLAPEYPVLVTQYAVLGTAYTVLDKDILALAHYKITCALHTDILVLAKEYPVQATKSPVLDTEYPVMAPVYHVHPSVKMHGAIACWLTAGSVSNYCPRRMNEGEHLPCLSM